MNLEQATQSLLEQFPSGSRPDLDRREHRIEKFGQLAFGGFMVVVAIAVLGLIYTILDRMVFSGDNPLVGVLLTAFIVFAALTLAYVIFSEDLKEKRKKGTLSPRPGELEAPAVTGRLLEEKLFEPVPSVTEDTTNLLPQEKTRRN